MTLYTAVRYRNDMSVFDHRTDGIVRCPAAAAKRAAPPLTGHRKTFSASQVMMIQIQIQIQMGICRAQLTNCPGALTNVRMLCETGEL